MEELLNEVVGSELYQMILSNPNDKGKISKVKIRPVMLKEELFFQETAYIGTQVFHTNYDKKALIECILTYMDKDFRQCEIETMKEKATILISKKGKITINRKRGKNDTKTDSLNEKMVDMSHNRKKKYILEKGTKVPFLVELGVQTTEGIIVRSKYDKFRQINRFLEFVEDVLPFLPKDKQINIIDFGCGKSYLTFAIYYYLKKLQGLDVKITGLDLKKDVIAHCNELARKYDYADLEFKQGDISTYDEKDDVDMVVTLHACDTATDYALAKAVEWKAKVILSVPCCQHEVNKQIICRNLQPALKYGLIKERMSALLTDAVRAGLLEEQGYEVQILEFIDMEHTPKNILIRAVFAADKINKMKQQESKIKDMTDFLHIETTLQQLL